jgi:hypothetical protein
MGDPARGRCSTRVAQNAARPGNEELASPGTPYAAYAEGMLKQPGNMKSTRIVCRTCHKPNPPADQNRCEQ